MTGTMQGPRTVFGVIAEGAGIITTRFVLVRSARNSV